MPFWTTLYVKSCHHFMWRLFTGGLRWSVKWLFLSLLLQVYNGFLATAGNRRLPQMDYCYYWEKLLIEVNSYIRILLHAIFLKDSRRWSNIETLIMDPLCVLPLECQMKNSICWQVINVEWHGRHSVVWNSDAACKWRIQRSAYPLSCA